MKLARLSLLVAMLAGSALAATAASAASGVVGQVYVNDNTAGVNTVAGFDRHADGTLTALAGSPFAVGGAGTGHGIGSQGALQFSATGAICSLLTRAATRSRCCGSSRTDSCSRSKAAPSHPTGSSRSASPSTQVCLCRQRRNWRQQLHRLHPQPGRPPRALANSTSRSQTGPNRAMCCSAATAATSSASASHLADRQLLGR